MAHHVASVRTYYTVSVALAVLLALTIAASRLDLGYFNVPAALLIAAAKAVLIILYFMHIRWSSPLHRLFAGAGFLWLMLLFVFLAADVLWR